MNNWLKYYYNINLEEVFEKNNYKVIVDNQNCFYIIYPYNKEKYSLEYINIIQSLLRKVPNNYFLIKYNTENKLVSILDKQEFFLLQVKGLINTLIPEDEIFSNLIPFVGQYNKNRANWEELWSKKIDYLEYQMAELSKNKKATIASFSFFSGLAENAISFLNINKVNYQQAHLSIVHTRVYYPNLAINYYNSLNLLLDYMIRDVAEYIKDKFLHHQDVDKNIKNLVNNSFFNADDIKLFYARLLFPTTYFDCIESILLGEESEKKLDPFIELNHNYLLLLKDTYYEISKKYSIIIPDWLKNQL
jgi:hypothetical protein